MGGPEVVGVVAAAGFATRLQPLGCSKEVLPVAGRPLMSYTLERMRLAGASRIRVVTRPDKEDVQAVAQAEGCELVLGTPVHMSASVALGLEGLADDTIVLLAWPDSVWLPSDGLAQIVPLVASGSADCALGLFRVEDPARSDTVVVDEEGRLVRIDIKRADFESDWIWGCVATRASVFRGVEAYEWPSELLMAARDAGVPIATRFLSETYLDIGTRPALAMSEAWMAERVLAG